MYLDQINSCCGIGELSQFEEHLEDENSYNDNYSFENTLDDIKKKVSDGGFDLIVATTPNQKRWIPIHWLLTLAKFIPVTSAKSKQGNYQNILWIYQKDPKKWMI